MRPFSSHPARRAYRQRSGLNSVMLVGRLVADPELRRTSNGVGVTRFRIAINVGNSTEFHSVAWRRLGELVARQFTNGQLIRVDGSLHTRQWNTNDAERRHAVEIIAEWCYSVPRDVDT